MVEKGEMDVDDVDPKGIFAIKREQGCKDETQEATSPIVVGVCDEMKNLGLGDNEARREKEKEEEGSGSVSTLHSLSSPLTPSPTYEGQMLLPSLPKKRLVNNSGNRHHSSSSSSRDMLMICDAWYGLPKQKRPRKERVCGICKQLYNFVVWRRQYISSSSQQLLRTPCPDQHEHSQKEKDQQNNAATATPADTTSDTRGRYQFQHETFKKAKVCVVGPRDVIIELERRIMQLAGIDQKDTTVYNNSHHDDTNEIVFMPNVTVEECYQKWLKKQNKHQVSTTNHGIHVHCNNMTIFDALSCEPSSNKNKHMEPLTTSTVENGDATETVNDTRDTSICGNDRKNNSRLLSPSIDNGNSTSHLDHSPTNQVDHNNTKHNNSVDNDNDNTMSEACTDKHQQSLPNNYHNDDDYDDDDDDMMYYLSPDASSTLSPNHKPPSAVIIGMLVDRRIQVNRSKVRAEQVLRYPTAQLPLHALNAMDLQNTEALNIDTVMELMQRWWWLLFSCLALHNGGYDQQQHCGDDNDDDDDDDVIVVKGKGCRNDGVGAVVTPTTSKHDEKRTRLERMMKRCFVKAALLAMNTHRARHPSRTIHGGGDDGDGRPATTGDDGGENVDEIGVIKHETTDKGFDKRE